jgi:hypothetical protein
MSRRRNSVLPTLSGSRKVRETAAADKKRLEDELTEERRKAMEATAQFNATATGEF